jgi:NADPH:quinone reductase-like Zn-dependent oxidoreductase
MTANPQRQGRYPFPLKDGVVPVSDGAGIVVAVGSRVSRFVVGDRVATTLHQRHLAGPLDFRGRRSAIGSENDGALREYASFSEDGLVAVPNNLTLNEAATLPCAALTAWSALYGLEGHSLKPSDFVLTEGTGGVSSFAVQVQLYQPKPEGHETNCLQVCQNCWGQSHRNYLFS